LLLNFTLSASIYKREDENTEVANSDETHSEPSPTQSAEKPTETKTTKTSSKPTTTTTVKPVATSSSSKPSSSSSSSSSHHSSSSHSSSSSNPPPSNSSSSSPPPPSNNSPPSSSSSSNPPPSSNPPSTNPSGQGNPPENNETPNAQEQNLQGNPPFGQNGFPPQGPPPGQFGDGQIDNNANKPKRSGLSTTVKLVISGSALAVIGIIFAGIFIYKQKHDSDSEYDGGFNNDFNNTGSIYPLTENQQMNYPQVNYPISYVPGSSQPSNYQGGSSQPSNYQIGSSQQSYPDDFNLSDNDNFDRKLEHRKSIDTTDQIYTAYQNLKPDNSQKSPEGQSYDDPYLSSQGDQFFYDTPDEDPVPNSPGKYRFRDQYRNREDGKPVSRYANYRNQLKF